MDAGIYTCTATNHLGNATASGALIVRSEKISCFNLGINEHPFMN